jgi:hypothetical protein
MKRRRESVWVGLNALIDAAGAAFVGLEEEEDAHSREVREEVQAHERRHEAELLAAAKRLSERSKP